MKRIIPIIMVFAMLASALTGCELIGGITNIPEATHEHNELVTSEPVAEATAKATAEATAKATAETTAEPTGEPAAEAVDFEPVLWKNKNYESHGGEIMVIDIDMDGQDDVIRYEELTDEEMTRMFIGDYVVDLQMYEPESVLAIDAVHNDGSLDLLVSGDVCSSDYVIFNLRIQNGKLTMVNSVGGSIGALDGDNIVVYQSIDRLGTWSTYRNYSFDLGGSFVPRSEREYVDESWFESAFRDPIPESDDDYAGYLYTLRPLTVTVDGEEITLPERTCLLPTYFDPDGTTGFVTSDGIRGTLFAYRTERYGSWYVDGAEEYDMFGGILYAG